MQDHYGHIYRKDLPPPPIAGEGLFLGNRSLDYFPKKIYFFPKYFWILKTALLVAWLQNEIVLKFLDFRPFRIEVKTFIQLFIQILTYSNLVTINFFPSPIERTSLWVMKIQCCQYSVYSNH